MKNISNQALFARDCTKCPTCGRASWYVIECDCGHTYCKYCAKEDDMFEEDSETLRVICPKCDDFMIYV